MGGLNETEIPDDPEYTIPVIAGAVSVGYVIVKLIGAEATWIYTPSKVTLAVMVQVPELRNVTTPIDTEHTTGVEVE